MNCRKTYLQRALLIAHRARICMRGFHCVSVTISKAIVIRNFIFCFRCAGRVIICLPFCSMRFDLRESGKYAKRHMSHRSLEHEFTDASRRVIACTMFKISSQISVSTGFPVVATSRSESSTERR